jgi:putative acetyltransferase
MQSRSGASEVQFFRDSNKVSQMTDFQITIHIEYVSITINKILDVWTNREYIFSMAVDTDEIRSTGRLVLRTFQAGDEKPFKELNEAWISRDFALEPGDREVLNDPQGKILDHSGEICVADLDGVVVGCCALVAMGPGEYELAKMTVSSEARGCGIGRRLMQFAIDHARTIGTRRLYLESNTKAASAIHLYEELGFRHLATPEHASKYARANVFMEMFL